MQWIDKIVEAAISRQPEGEILVSSGASPSGIYHFGHLREVITCDAIVLSLRKKGREARHIHVVDNLDALRKVPVNLPESYSQYLGMALCDIPAPDNSGRSYADYCFDPFAESMVKLGIEFDTIYQNLKYQEGFYVPAIERSLERIDQARSALEEVSGRTLDINWTPIQIMENGRLKNRQYLGINTDNKIISFKDAEGNDKTIEYNNGKVKLDWRLDWPGRWWLMNVIVEPFGQDHASKGGSYDTGLHIARDVYDIEAPIPVPYEFVNRTGDTKKMSASKGTGVNARDIMEVLPAEVARFFMLRYPPSKRLYFDETESLMKLVDEYSELLDKKDRTELEDEIIYLSSRGISEKTISNIPFSLLVETFQASLGDVENTLEAIGRTEYVETVKNEADIIRREIDFVSRWLEKWAPEKIKFSPLESVDINNFDELQLAYLRSLSKEIASAPLDADGQWFHNVIYAHKESSRLQPKELFSTLYQALIGKYSGPRAGWFLSILPRDWLVERLSMKN